MFHSYVNLNEKYLTIINAKSRKAVFFIRFTAIYLLLTLSFFEKMPYIYYVAFFTLMGNEQNAYFLSISCALMYRLRVKHRWCAATKSSGAFIAYL